jgi:hypothetical protein
MTAQTPIMVTAEIMAGNLTGLISVITRIRNDLLAMARNQQTTSADVASATNAALYQLKVVGENLDY